MIRCAPLSAIAPRLVLWMVALIGTACQPAAPSQPIATDTDTCCTNVTQPETPTLGDMVQPALNATPAGSLFLDTETVTLTATDPDATIWYTVDGSAPQPGVSEAYTEPLVLTESTQIRAIAELATGSVVSTAPTFIKLQASADGFATDLPVVALWSRQSAPETKEEAYTNFSVVAVEPGGGQVALPSHATTAVRAGLKVRGSSSAGYPKRPYRLETWPADSNEQIDEDIEWLGLPAEADWVFLAPLDFDRALSRNALIYQLSNDIGRQASRTRFVEVFVVDNGAAMGTNHYVGVYLVVERIERGRDRVDITQLLPSDLAVPEVTGGYIFKEDRLGPNEGGFTAGTAGGRLEFEQPFVMVEPDEVDLQGPQEAYIVDLLDELGVALTSTDFTHPVTGRHYDQIIDVDAWIDHHILNVLTKNPDAFRLSGFFHKDRNGLLAAGPIWDFDRTMGCESDTRAQDPTWWDPSNQTSDTTYVFEHGFWKGLFQDPVFQQRYWDRWTDLLATNLSMPAIEAHLDAYEQELEDAAPRNFAKWSDYPPRGGSLGSEMDLLRDWLAERHAWISDCLTRPDPMLCPGD